MHAALALQSALYSNLVAHDALTSLLGGGHVYDNLPRKQKPPYVIFGEATHNDWSTGSDTGMEHFITLNVWSSQNSRKQVLQISDEITSALQISEMDIGGHHLVNFVHEVTEVKRDEETGYFTATITYRAVTEPTNV